MKNIFTLIIGLVLINACKPKLLLPEGAPEALRTNKLLEQVEQARFDFKQLSLKGSGKYEGQGMKLGFRFEIRVQKDSLIWVDLSDPLLGLGLVRGKLDADQYVYINRLERNYRQGAPKEAAQSIGLDFEMPAVMNIIAANYWPLESAEQKGAVGQYLMEGYLQVPGSEERKAKQYLDAKLFRPSKVLVNEARTQRNLKLSYAEYQELEGQWYPHYIEIDFQDGEEQSKIELNVKSIEINQALNFPFRIPSAYKRMP